MLHQVRPLHLFFPKYYSLEHTHTHILFIYLCNIKSIAEIALIMKANDKCDVYSFGVLTLEIIMGEHPIELILSLAEDSTTNDLLLKEVLDPKFECDNGECLGDMVGSFMVCPKFQLQQLCVLSSEYVQESSDANLSQEAMASPGTTKQNQSSETTSNSYTTSKTTISAFSTTSAKCDPNYGTFTIIPRALWIGMQVEVADETHFEFAIGTI